jgi:hypothetical protein
MSKQIGISDYFHTLVKEKAEREDRNLTDIANHAFDEYFRKDRENRGGYGGV